MKKNKILCSVILGGLSISFVMAHSIRWEEINQLKAQREEERIDHKMRRSDKARAIVEQRFEALEVLEKRERRKGYNL